MTQEEKARAYDEALERARKQRADYQKELNKIDKNSPFAGLFHAGITTIDMVFPELRESEDERIIKALINALKTSKSVGELKFIFPEPTREECIAYLEKQKEQEHICDSAQYEEGFKTGLEIGLRKQKEQKQEWEPKPESLEALMYAIEGKWDRISPTSYLSRRLEDLYEGLVNTFNVDESLIAELPKVASRDYTAEEIEELRELKRKIETSMEQKPTECADDVVEEAEEYTSKVDCGEYGAEVTEAYIAGVLAERNRKPAEVDVKALLTADRLASAEMTGRLKERSEILENPEKYGLQKPAEWSEEDKGLLLSTKCVIDEVWHSENTFGYSKEELEEIWNWLNVAWTKLEYPKENNEWSKEDEKQIRQIERIVKDAGCSVKLQEQIHNWLKSLRPPLKDRDMKLKILKYLSTRCSSFEFEEVEDYLNNLRPSWKPSEEQMKAFSSYIKDFQEKAEAAVGGWNNFDVMIRLYEQLKKL